ncbi:unnamed protein product [marine sediment metagenome]|uniref:Uncharacterized protein n=1 Tax=marine sediment metagenome TaxID=412755 RepID=X1QLW0_9ZZZZ
MTEELAAKEAIEELTPEQKLELADALPIGEGKVVFDACHLTVKDGHIVAECDSIEASKELALLLVEDVFIRVKPVKVTDEAIAELTE